MHTCKQCEEEFEGKFCPECGTPWVEKKVCPMCGAEAKDWANFCESCGAPLTQHLNARGCFNKGLECEQKENYMEAAKWFRMAAELGLAAVKDVLKKLGE